MKRLLALFCACAVLVTGCGGSGSENADEATAKPSQGKKYVEQEFNNLPDENEIYGEDELNVTDLQTNAEGEPALYQYVVGADDEDDKEKFSIYEYTLNSAGDWQTKQYGGKALTKLVTKTLEGAVDDVDIPYILRGDDGNLYALLQVKLYDENANPFDKESGPCEYYLLTVDENTNAVQKTKLQTKVEENGQETDYAKEYDVTGFHVAEDGTPMLVFNTSSAMWFDAVSGTRTNLCESISDGAFAKRVGYGENEIVYYSMSKKNFGVLDSDTLSRTSEFGDDISEDNKKYEWYFDSDTTNWQMYAFNLSGLYRFSDFGQKTSATRLSADGSFDSLADAVIYDVLVGANQELYLLVRRTITGEIQSDVSYDFGVVKYAPKE